MLGNPTPGLWISLSRRILKPYFGAPGIEGHTDAVQV